MRGLSLVDFKEEIDSFVFHHIGIAVAKIEAAIAAFQNLGWILEEDPVIDVERGVRLAFLKRVDSGEMLELVSPLHDNSPVSSTLKMMKNASTPYHICYEVKDIEQAILVLRKEGYQCISVLMPAVAFQGRRVVFLLNINAGLVELLEA